MRPRFVVVLCVAAWLTAGVELLGALETTGSHAGLLAVRLRGAPGTVGRLLESLVLSFGAWGLWTLRPWARIAAMVYLAAVILSLLFFGVGVGSDRATWTLVWQITVVPFATFCYMFLHNGRRHFATRSLGSGEP